MLLYDFINFKKKAFKKKVFGSIKNGMITLAGV